MRLDPWVKNTLFGFGAFNILIGITLFFWYPKIPLIIVSPLIAQNIWAIIFTISGLVMMFGLLKHYLVLLHFMMIFGLFIKVMWEIGLLFRVREGGTLFLVELWGMIAYLQLLGVVYFSPRHDNGAS